MPIIRKLIQVGKSKAITIPKSWINYYQRETGQKLDHVVIEINDVLTIRPLRVLWDKENHETKDATEGDGVLF